MTSRSASLIALLFFSLCALLPAGQAQESGAGDSRSRPVAPQGSAKGMLLVAARGMPDPRFKRAVILLVEHGREGALGFIVNHPLDATLADASPDFLGAASERYHVNIGGPSMMDTMMFLARSGAILERAELVLPGVWLSASRQTLEQVMDAQIRPEDLRVYVGHADWRAGQLEGELAQGNWHLTPADDKLVFAEDATKVWPRLINRWEPLGIMAGAARSGHTRRPG
jgi:putative transcriptional regulator